MSIAELQRLKALEAENVILKSRLEKLEAHCFGVGVDDEMNDFKTDISGPRRKPGRPRKDEGCVVG